MTFGYVYEAMIYDERKDPRPRLRSNDIMMTIGKTHEVMIYDDEKAQ
jgi:hypothetical protein